MKLVQPPAVPLPERKPEPPVASAAPAGPAADPSAPSFRAVLADNRKAPPPPARKPQVPHAPTGAGPADAPTGARVAEIPSSPPVPGTKPLQTLFLANEAVPPAPVTNATAAASFAFGGGQGVAAGANPPPLRFAVVPDAPVPGRKPGVETQIAAAPVPDRKPEAALQVAEARLPERKPEAPPAPPTAAERLTLASQQVAGLSGHSYAAILAQASQESSMDPMAKSRTSSAAGPFQFLERTWLDLIRRHGAAYGLGELAGQIENRKGLPVVRDAAVRKQILELRHDIDLSAGMAARFLAEGRDRLEARLKRPVTETESRIAYIMGVGGATKLIRAAERTPHAAAADLLPAAAKANGPLFYDRATGRALTAVETVSRLTHRMNTDQRAMFAAIDEAAQRIVLDGKPSPLGSFRMVGRDVDGSDGGGSALG